MDVRIVAKWVTFIGIDGKPYESCIGHNLLCNGSLVGLYPTVESAEKSKALLLGLASDPLNFV